MAWVNVTFPRWRGIPSCMRLIRTSLRISGLCLVTSVFGIIVSDAQRTFEYRCRENYIDSLRARFKFIGKEPEFLQVPCARDPLSHKLLNLCLSNICTTIEVP